MTSQYSNKTKTTLTAPAAMRINPTSPYQQMHQQQPAPTSAPQRHHPQQPQTQQQLHNALQSTTAPAQLQTAATVNSAASHFQGVFNNGDQQQNSWPAQQTGYLPSTKMMQPTSPPPAASAVAQQQTPAGANSWPQQQQQPQQVQHNFQNVNMYQQNAATPQQQQWPQNPLKMTATATYDNYYQQPSPVQANNNMYQQQQPPAAAAPQNPATFCQQQAPATQNQTNPVNFFDNANNNQQTGTVDGWGDWDWNDNSNTAAATPAPNTAPVAEHTQIKAELQPQANYNTSIIADSFSSQNNNDSWTWGANENEQHVNNNNMQKEPPKLDNVNQSKTDNWSWNANANDSEKLQQQQQLPAPGPNANEQYNDNWNWQSANENQQHVANAAKPAPPPPTEFSANNTAENHNYNTNAAANNIPNTVFVTQAKPVTLPPRQYASPPGGNTPVTENPPETALMPPQGFQNVEEAAPIRPAAIVSPHLPPPYVATPPVANVAPPAGLPPAASSAGNPFKRSGVAQHHRATGLMATAAAPAAMQLPIPAPTPAVFNMPPPPPADFANPGSVTLIEPDNNELPSQENQEVLTPPTTNITLPNVATTLPTAPITLPNTPASQPVPPPNDERNQYLQTSHLSENAEEQQPEADGLLPPPGLSRLVLGEPELEASQQRMVMGTEANNTDNAATQAAAMHLEERHADGEDTASENAVPVISSTGQGAPPTSSTLSSDRNLYLVPGESNNETNNQPQRVVTGVELAEQREIEMDGENLEDEQIQQQQQQQQQHQQHHNHQQNQHQVLSPEARNEPPVEGADDNVVAAPTVNVTNTSHTVADHQLDHQHAHHHATNQLPKIKDPNPISSPNDDDDSDERLLNDRGINPSTAGSSKSRAKYENERLAAASRRRDKRSSTERYESDEYLNSEGEYSSEREEIERRERDSRRNYREGSVRSERGNDEEEKRSRRQRTANKRDKYYYEGEERSRGGEGREERERDRGAERSKAERRSLRQRGYEADSRYETEESSRFDIRKDPNRRSMRRGDRTDQGADYDDYNRRGAYRTSKRPTDNYEFDRRDRRRSDKHRDPRYREDPRYDPREYEDYRKHSSRNARESDMEKEGAVTSRSGRMHHDPRHAAMYGYPSGGYYDTYTAYYYQQMARTNPQAYAEWYKKYYGQAAAGAALGANNAGHVDNSLPATGNDGRESVHSGRSSAHNDIKDRSGALSLRDSDPVAQEPQRLTPCKFITEHTVVNFASGILVTAKPKYTPNGSISNVVKLLKFKPNDETRKLFKVFPGPLVRGLTHKKTVIEFCHEQIRLGPLETTIFAKQLITNNGEKYRGSYTLMWNLLILLLKQNGMVVGTDIAELLLKNQQQYPYKTPNSTANNSMKSKSGSASPEEELELTKDLDLAAEVNKKADSSEPESIANIKELLAEQEDTNEDNSGSNSVSLSEPEITEKFRNYLLYGNVNEALEWATDNNLWGHALFLASKLDRRSHANVMMKFANKLSLNDPLQTLYQLMSGRTPSSVTCVQDEKWGDWRPHLSMILSNTSQKPELDRKAITTLGDSLFNRGDLYAAHFCYLMAQVGFGRYQESANQETSLQQHLPKLVLLGSSHYKQFQDFGNNEAIIMTEIYEYACSLNDDKFSIIEFQPYKYLLSTRLLDYGFHLKSLMYLEQISVHIARDPCKYESSFINKVYEMADRLKYYDPVLEKTIDDQQPGSDDNNMLNLTAQQMEEQKWLQNLRQLAQQTYKNELITTANQQISTVATQPAPHQDNTYYNPQQQQIDQQFMEINKQFRELNLQYQGQMQTQQPNIFYNPEKQTQLQEQAAVDSYQQPAEVTHLNAKDMQPTQDASIRETTQDTSYQQQHYLQPTELTQQPVAAGYANNYYDPLQQTEQYNNTPPAGVNNLDGAQQVEAAYDYWGQQQQQQHTHMAHLAEEPELTTSISKDLLLLKKSQKTTATLKAHTTNNNTANTLMAAGAKTPLALHTKKSPQKTKSNISSNNTKLTNRDKLKTTLSTTPTATKSSSPAAKKSLDLVQTPTAFNKQLANTNELMVSNNATAPPFSINNVSNLNKQQPALPPAAFNNASPNNIKAKSINLLRPPKTNKTDCNTILKPAPVTMATNCHNSNNLNDLSCSHTQIKKVNFIIPAEKLKVSENLELTEYSSGSTDDNTQNQAAKSAKPNTLQQDWELTKTKNTVIKYQKPQQQQRQQQQQQATTSAQHNYKHNIYKHKKEMQHLQQGFLNKNIVYNGTFPIDMPLQTRFNNYDPEANCSAHDYMDYEAYESSSNAEEDDEDVEDNEEYEDDYDEDDLNHEANFQMQQTKSLASSYGLIKVKTKSPLTQKPPQVWSMQELINDPSIPLNYKKMCNEVEQSLPQFEQYIDNKEDKGFKITKPPVLRTFNIDDPIDLKKNI